VGQRLRICLWLRGFCGRGSRNGVGGRIRRCGPAAAPAAGGRSAEKWLRNSRGRPNGWLFRQFGGAMARCLQKRRSKSPRTQADTRSAKETFGQATSKVGSSAKQRLDSFRLQNELVDIGTYCSGDSEKVSSLLPSLSSLANPEADGLQLPKARTQSSRTRRTGDSHLAKERLAPYKKKPEKAVKPLFCWMKAALCFSRPFGEPGLGKDKLPFIIAGTAATDCRLFLPLRFRRNAGIWELYFAVCDHNIVTNDFETFVAELVSHFSRGFILVMDRWMVHRSGAKRLQRRFSRVDVEWLPPYAPDFNPVEQVWNRSKYTDLTNYIPENIGELEKEVCESISHMRCQQSLLRSFFKKIKLKL
jgi:hypothetical protein